MLAVQVLAAAHPVLSAARPEMIQARFDVLRGFPQSPPVPTARIPSCICSDQDFIERAGHNNAA
jgi:hypothetical protein